MAKLDSGSKEMFGKQLSMIATASKQGVPNVGPKGSVLVVDDETMVFSESTDKKTASNLKENPVVALIVYDRDKAEGYQVKGRTEMLTGGELFDQVATRQQQRNKPVPKYVVKIKVEEVYTFKSGVGGKRIA